MEWDYSSIEDSLANLGQAKLQMENLINDLESLAVPTEIHFDELTIAATNQLAAQAKKDRDMVSEQILAIYNNLRTLEYQIAGMTIDDSDAHVHLGDTTSLGADVKYTENAWGGGDYGSTGSEIRPEGDYVIYRAAFLDADGKLLLNTTETGADIEECRMQLAEEYGINPNDINVVVGVSYKTADDTGWLTGDFTYEDIANAKKEAHKQANIENVNKKVETISNQAANLDEEMQKIEEKYNNVELDEVNSQVAQAVVRDHSGDTIESVSLKETLKESSLNVGIGALKVPLTAVTGAVDITTNAVTLGHGTSLTKYEWEALEEIGDYYKEGFREKGGVNMDDYKTIQELSGAAAVVSVVAAAAATAAPAAGAATSTELATVESGEVLTGEVVYPLSTEVATTAEAEVIDVVATDVVETAALETTAGNTLALEMAGFEGATAAETAGAAEVITEFEVLDSAGNIIATYGAEAAGANTNAIIAKVLLGGGGATMGIGGAAAALSDNG